MVGLGVGIGFTAWGTSTAPAASVRPAAPYVPPFERTGEVAFLGVEISATNPTGPAGARVVGVVGTSPAAKAGIVAGDVITSFGTRTVVSALTLQVDVRRDSPGQHVKVVWTTSSGKHETATVTLGTRRVSSTG